MKHLGDITKIKGCNAPVVDCIIGGSPCQDLSVAGKRAGLAGERSGLYMEQIRIIKEMRYKDEQSGRTGESIRPRYMVWENVPGAFSSNGGKDFAAVIEEAIKVAEQEAPSVPVPEKGWPTSGCFMGDNWSVAWRVLDAQFWGVPQRRRRIALVADFGGQSAPEVLFVRNGVSGNLESGEQKRKETAGDAGASSGGTSKAVGFPLGFRPENVRCYDEMATTLCNGTRPGFTTGVIQEQPLCIEMTSTKNTIVEDGICPTLTARMGTGGNQVNAVMEPVIGIDQQGGKGGANYSVDVSPPILSDSHGTPHAVAYTLEPSIAAREGGHIYEGVSGTLRAKAGDNQMAVCCCEIFHCTTEDKIAQPLKARDYKDPLVIAYKEDHGAVAHGVDCRNATELPEQNITLQSSCCHNLNSGNVARVKHIVRRLTPGECELLQGFPKGWTDIGEWIDSKGKKHKEADSPRYKALGNSIALPPWKWVLKRLCGCYERDATMASLFDGIGGFPYIWEQLNGKGSCLWASEVEQFPIAVTKKRFGD